MSEIEDAYNLYLEQNSSAPTATQLIKFANNKGTKIKYSEANNYIKSRSSTLISQSTTQRVSLTTSTSTNLPISNTKPNPTTNDTTPSWVKVKPNTTTEPEKKDENTPTKVEENKTDKHLTFSEILKQKESLNNSKPINKTTNHDETLYFKSKNPVTKKDSENKLPNTIITKLNPISFDDSSMKKQEPVPKKEVIKKSPALIAEQLSEQEAKDEKTTPKESLQVRKRAPSHVKANSFSDASDLPTTPGTTNIRPKAVKKISKKKKTTPLISHKKNSSYTEADKNDKKEALKKTLNASIKDPNLYMNDPVARKKAKKQANQSAGGFAVHVNRRYKLIDGRIGVCKFKGRTMFGKSHEDWIGLKLDVGEGKHDGTVKGKLYFRCRPGKGIMVRPQKLIIDLGSETKQLTKEQISEAEKDIIEYQKMQEKETKKHATKKSDVVSNYNYDSEWKPAEWDDFKEDHGSHFLDKKLINPVTLVNKNKDKKADKKKHHTEV